MILFHHILGFVQNVHLEIMLKTKYAKYAVILQILIMMKKKKKLIIKQKQNKINI